MRSSLLLANLLAVVPFISASPTRFEPARRDTPIFVPTVPVPDGGIFSFQGCVGDSESSRVLDNGVKIFGGSITTERCVIACADSSFKFAGVENGGVSCFCDNQLNGINGGTVDEDDCKVPCPGNSTEACGGFNLLLLYQRD